MAKIRNIDSLHDELALTLDERKLVQDHAAKEGLTFSESLEDFFEYAILQSSGQPNEHGKDPVNDLVWELETPCLKVCYPQHGPLANLTAEEKGFIGCLLLESFEVALHAIISARSVKEKVNVMERAGKGMGTGESPIPVV